MIAAKSSVIFLILAVGVNGDGDTTTTTITTTTTALWVDATVCALGSTCNNCEHNASWWSTDSFTACGEQPASADLPTCAVNADLTAACKCSTHICGIGHYCYGDGVKENCHHAEMSSSCAVDDTGATAVTAACRCGGSFVSSITAGLIDAAPLCSVEEFCYDNTCNDEAKVVPTLPPAMLPVVCVGTAFGCCSHDTVARIDEAGSNCDDTKDGVSTLQWVLIVGGIVLLVGILAAAICCMMSSGGSTKRGLKSSKKNKKSSSVLQQLEEAQPLVQPAGSVLLQPPVTYAAPPQYNNLPAIVHPAVTYEPQMQMPVMHQQMPVMHQQMPVMHQQMPGYQQMPGQPPFYATQ